MQSHKANVRTKWIMKDTPRHMVLRLLSSTLKVCAIVMCPFACRVVSMCHVDRPSPRRAVTTAMDPFIRYRRLRRTVKSCTGK